MCKIIEMYILLALIFIGAACTEPLSGELPVQSKTNEIDIERHIKEGNRHFDEDRFPNSLKSYQNALEIAEAQKSKKKIHQLWGLIGENYKSLHQYPEALEYLIKYVELPEGHISEKNRAKGIGHLAEVYRLIGDNENSYKYRLKALELSEAANNDSEICRNLYELGSFFFYQDNFREALEYYQQSLTCNKKLGANKPIYSSLGAIGSTYEELNLLDSSLFFSFQSLELAEQINFRRGIAYASHNIGAAYLKKQDFARALRYLNQSLEIKEEKKDLWGQIADYKALGQLFTETGDFQTAIAYVNKGLSIAEKIGATSRKTELLTTLSKAQFNTKNFQGAYQTQLTYIALKDSLLSNQLIEKISNFKSRYEVQRREAEIGLLKKEKQINKLFWWLLITILTMIIIISIFLLRNYLIQKKTADILQDKNIQIQDQNDQLEKMNEELKQFTYGVSHDLKAPLRTVGGFSAMLKRKFHKLLDDEGKEYLELVMGGVKQMQGLLEQLLEYARIGVSGSKLEVISTNDIIKNAVANLQHQINEQEAVVKIQQVGAPRVKVNQTQITQLFQNLIGNGIKFRKKDQPQIEVNWQANGTKYIFSIKDNGIGIAPEYRKKIFEMFSRLHSKDEVEGSGIGLATCKKIVENHGGEIWVESEPGEGSTFFFTLPKEN